ncbi:PLP-dependent aminotransferase family protein [Pseudonocardia sp. GCM10023141]|uniref:MocR-like pyridoxine biosynthesis transcription factor PdxR n=1 Tax=Pseudonocardia sp. GCM10023141 TaxID=3252653 RepID=UPI003610036B
MDLPPLLLDRTDGRPLAVQLVAALRAAAVDGTLRAGDRLPSTRMLAATLGVSRTVTSAAYDQLLAEGWVAARHGSGTFVVGMPAARRVLSLPSAPRPRPDADRADRVGLYAGVPCVEVLDRAAWRRAWRVASDAPPDADTDSAGLAELRGAVVEHLMRHRGLPADPAEVLVTAGSTAAIGEIARTLQPGARVAVEEPGYQRAVGAFRAAGLVTVAVPVDEAGLVVDALPAGIAAVYCTPAHQFPLGARLSAARRVALVSRARAEGFLVVEDDYDGELRYDVAPLPLLAALGRDVVAHLGTASKLLTPTLGIGWLVAPAAVRAAVVDLRERTGARPARAGQRVFAALAAHGDLARHLRRLRRELADRRAATVAAVVGAGHTVLGDAAGAHIAVPLPDAAAERAVLRAAAVRGVGLEGLAAYHEGPAATAGIVIGYAGPPRPDLDRALPLVGAALTAGSP